MAGMEKWADRGLFCGQPVGGTGGTENGKPLRHRLLDPLAGLGLDAGMRRVAEELDDSHPEVCSEFGLCNMQLQMGRPRRDVLP